MDPQTVFCPNLDCAARGQVGKGNGSFAYDGTRRWLVKPIQVPVVDTTGAGDAFIGAFAYAFDKGMEVHAAMEWANTVAALSVSRPGSILSFPTLEEVQGYIKG